ncbi:hypothetical protein F4780DRAFT_773244 [Xylariomycetidae sp. FL0641]|nr:hypothetical protein F4780DRAFT_773244 [Xylariomycetidae sp. FL0641]
MSQLPEGTTGDAVGVLLFCFICLLTNGLLIWLHWVSREKLSYVALISYFAMLCTLSSIIQQIYNYTLWDDLMSAQLYHIKAHPHNADVIFQNGNFGFMRVLAIIRLFCYIVESSYLLAYTIQITSSMYGHSSTLRVGRRTCSLLGISLPIVLASISIGLLQTSAVQSSFTVYMIVANAQAVTACSVSIFLIVVILSKFIRTKRFWRSVDRLPTDKWWRFGLKSKGSSGSDDSGQEQRRAAAKVFDNSWLVFRLTVAIVLISVATHLPQRDDIDHDAQADAPDLSPERARSNIIGYIFGVTPGLAIWIVFGLTKHFRHIMYERLVPAKWKKREGQLSPLPPGPWHRSTAGPSSSKIARTASQGPSDADLELGDLEYNAQRRASASLTTMPLLMMIRL